MQWMSVEIKEGHGKKDKKNPQTNEGRGFY
jgi:hypothetical protein